MEADVFARRAPPAHMKSGKGRGEVPKQKGSALQHAATPTNLHSEADDVAGCSFASGTLAQAAPEGNDDLEFMREVAKLQDDDDPAYDYSSCGDYKSHHHDDPACDWGSSSPFPQHEDDKHEVTKPIATIKRCDEDNQRLLCTRCGI